MTALPVPRASVSGSTPLPIAHDQIVNIDWLNAGALVIARKVTAKDVATTVETDLLNGEFTLPGGVLGTRGLMRLAMWGDFLLNNASANGPRFKFKMGSGPTTILDTASPGAASANASRGWWRTRIDLMNLGATGSQLCVMDCRIATPGNSPGGTVLFATGNGVDRGVAAGTGFDLYEMVGENSAAVDTTADQLLQFTVTLNNATNVDWQLLGAILEIV